MISFTSGSTIIKGKILLKSKDLFFVSKQQQAQQQGSDCCFEIKKTTPKG